MEYGATGGWQRKESRRNIEGEGERREKDKERGDRV